ncbi:hypothetical protein K458DRAFT_425182 [Lentithecium fluviatile CBS 122367]|uniref:Uncharacterized protein n=1 Tax=Lentithecium fluviatile CBS 122367 TaxID=1168545 RepID=A0A6G1ICE8_9PLEO|nr:hypothetical protein K458DRAFT_425182 [Lentithecium fluviatile CBS 122367]
MMPTNSSLGADYAFRRKKTSHEAMRNDPRPNLASCPLTFPSFSLRLFSACATRYVLGSAGMWL